jgi:hypothetical protein
MNEIRVTSWNELQDSIFADAWRPDIQRFRSPYAFRGLAMHAHGLETSLSRLGGHFADMERHLLRNFRKYASRRMVERDSIWNWLALAKHHGLPTRLLDWSFSPFVAMHFLTANMDLFDQDGVIWAVKYREVHQHLPEALKEELRQEGSDVFTVEILSKKFHSLDAFDASAAVAFVLFFEPPSLDERISNQFALFSMMSGAQGDMCEWLEQYPHFYRKIIVPAELKWEIRDKLDQANITERVLFPGLDGLSSWLKRQYMERPSVGKR